MQFLLHQKYPDSFQRLLIYVLAWLIVVDATVVVGQSKCQRHKVSMVSLRNMVTKPCGFKSAAYPGIGAVLFVPPSTFRMAIP